MERRWARAMFNLSRALGSFPHDVAFSSEDFLFALAAFGLSEQKFDLQWDLGEMSSYDTAFLLEDC